MPDLALARLLQSRGIRDTRVLSAIAALDRTEFVPPSKRAEAGQDAALSIGYGQTISQPWVVAYMTEQLHLAGDERALEVGTGSGYQAAVLGQLCEELWTIERWPQLAWAARERLEKLGLDDKVHVLVGDGMAGLAEHAPYDAILVTAAAPEVPPALVAQLAPGGRMVIPVGSSGGPQHLERITRRVDGTLTSLRLLDVQFVPLLPGVVEPPSA
ncbi:MAG: protein-L-isoaspartate(D-aspartate) O-methyltransferase [Deltaproteobacteria bacterium]|nr:protein-L-isoaspartate(D-aspartate) O-methyltransferase [Deltaproteobacteria bacterium]